MSEQDQRELREWVRLLDRALARPSLIDDRTLDTPTLRLAFLAVPPAEFFERAHTPTLERGDEGLFGHDVADAMEAVAVLLDALDTRPTDRVMEIGTGLGYTTAVLAGLVREVHSIERNAATAERARKRIADLGLVNVTIHTQDGGGGLPALAPFDRILVSASGARAAIDVKRQMRVGGRMLLVTGLHRLHQSPVRILRTDDNTYTEERLGSHRLRMRLGDMLVHEGLVTRERVETVASLAKSRGRRLGEMLLESGTVDVLEITRALATQARMRHCVAEDLLGMLEPGIAAAVPRAFLHHNHILPVARRDGRVIVATSELDPPVAELTKVYAPLRIELCLVSAADMQRLWRSVKLLPDEGAHSLLASVEEPAIEDASGPDVAASRHVALFDNLILDAIARRASDVHLERYGRNVRVRIRVDGDLHDLDHVPLSPADMRGVVNVVKIRADMDIAERRLPQGGRITMRGPDGPVDLRVQTQPSLHGEHAVVRILPRDRRMLALDDLGFPEALASRYRRLLDSPAGLVLVVGPTGSGKTTTLYAALQQLARDSTRKVITVEDPIEYSLDGIQQTQVHDAIGYTFDAAVRAFLREDPDVILVGEVRDPVTALEAIRASQTGHIVLTTLHCNDATDAVQRLRDLGLHPHSIAAELLAVIAQHLARRLCEACRVPVPPDPSLAAEVFPNGVPEGFRCFDAPGCARCEGRGSRGRIAVIEYMQVDQPLRDAIALRPSSGELRRDALGRGLHTMRESAIELVMRGVISLPELRHILPLDRMAPE